MKYNDHMRAKLILIVIIIALVGASCTTGDLYKASYVLDTTADVLDLYSDIIDLTLDPPRYHYPRPLPPPPPRPPYRPPVHRPHPPIWL